MNIVFYALTGRNRLCNYLCSISYPSEGWEVMEECFFVMTVWEAILLEMLGGQQHIIIIVMSITIMYKKLKISQAYLYMIMYRIQNLKINVHWLKYSRSKKVIFFSFDNKRLQHYSTIRCRNNRHSTKLIWKYTAINNYASYNESSSRLSY